MSTINNEQLFTELTPAQGADVSGGGSYGGGSSYGGDYGHYDYDEYYICNKTYEGINYYGNDRGYYLESGEDYSFNYDGSFEVKYDADAREGYDWRTQSLDPGKKYSFYQEGWEISLVGN